jgi:hypothetical protein
MNITPPSGENEAKTTQSATNRILVLRLGLLQIENLADDFGDHTGGLPVQMTVTVGGGPDALVAEVTLDHGQRDSGLDEQGEWVFPQVINQIVLAQ